MNFQLFKESVIARMVLAFVVIIMLIFLSNSLFTLWLKHKNRFYDV